MKTRNPLMAKFLSLLSLGLGFAAGAAAAQTTLFYSNPGSGANGGAVGVADLASIGFDMGQWNATAGVAMADTGANQTNPYINPALPERIINFSAPELASTLYDGAEALESVTLFLYVTGINPDGTGLDFTLHDELNGAGDGHVLSLTGGLIEDTFIELTVTAAQFLGGFSIASTGLPTNASLQFASEVNSDSAKHPGLLATYTPVPEPSIGILGGMGALILIRRRRA